MKNLNMLFEESVAELNAIGIIPGNVSSLVVNTRAKKRWGYCRKLPDGRYEIQISDRLLFDDVDDTSTKNTIIHELLHTVEGCLCHTGKWKKLAERVNRAYSQYNIKRTSTAEEKGIDEKPIIPTYKYTVKCPQCGTVYRRIKKTKLVKYPERYRCGICRHSLIREK